MKCPYCKKPNFVPNVVTYNAEVYGGGVFRFYCIHCRKVVKISAKRVVRFGEASKTNGDPDWEYRET